MCVCALDCLVNYILGSARSRQRSQGAGETKAEPLCSLLKLQEISVLPTELQHRHCVPHFAKPSSFSMPFRYL